MGLTIVDLSTRLSKTEDFNKKQKKTADQLQGLVRELRRMKNPVREDGPKSDYVAPAGRAGQRSPGRDDAAPSDDGWPKKPSDRYRRDLSPVQGEIPPQPEITDVFPPFPEHDRTDKLKPVNVELHNMRMTWSRGGSNGFDRGGGSFVDAESGPPADDASRKPRLAKSRLARGIEEARPQTAASEWTREATERRKSLLSRTQTAPGGL